MIPWLHFGYIQKFHPRVGIRLRCAGVRLWV